MHFLKQLSIFAENKPGRLEKVTRVLAEKDINILAISISSSPGGFGVIKFIVDKPDEGLKALKEKGFTVSLTPVLAIGLEDRPGGLHAVAEILSRHGINIENAHVFIPDSRERAYLIVEVEDVDKAYNRLKDENLKFYKER